MRVVGLPPPRGQAGREDRPTLRLLAATNLCFAERNVYTSEVLAVVMQQLMEQSPLPMLLMRTVIQSLTMYPRLGGFVMNILSRLIMKQVTPPLPALGPTGSAPQQDTWETDWRPGLRLSCPHRGEPGGERALGRRQPLGPTLGQGKTAQQAALTLLQVGHRVAGAEASCPLLRPLHPARMHASAERWAPFSGKA